MWLCPRRFKVFEIVQSIERTAHSSPEHAARAASYQELHYFHFKRDIHHHPHENDKNSKRNERTKHAMDPAESLLKALDKSILQVAGGPYYWSNFGAQSSRWALIDQAAV
jgi:hypothetical protein